MGAHVVKAAKAAKKEQPVKRLETTLWEAADKLRGNLESSEYKHVALGLVFLKYVSDAFDARRVALEANISDPASAEFIPNEQRRAAILESRDEYTGENVFWVPPERVGSTTARVRSRPPSAPCSTRQWTRSSARTRR